MTLRTHLFAAAAAIGALAVPAAAQTAYPYGAQPQYQVPQPYPGQPGYGYAQQGYSGQYGYNQGYAQNPVGQIIDQLLGNRYNVTDRQAVSRCASAAMVQAQGQYGGDSRYGQQYGQGYNRYGQLRVTSITDVQRRNNGLRVTGLMSSGANYRGQYGNPNGNYAMGDVSFRCNVDYRGAVTNIRIGRNTAYNR
jgi:hypothetical protein